MALNHYLVEDCCNTNRSILIIVPGAALDDGLYEFPLADPVNGFDLNSSNGNNEPAYLVFPGFCYKFTYLGQTGATFDIVPQSFINQVLDISGTHARECNAGVTCTDCDAGQYYIKADPCCEGDAIFFRGEPYIGGSQGGSMPSFNINQYNGVETYTPVNISTSTSIIPGYPLIPNQCYTWSIGVVGDGLSGAPATLAEYDLLFYPPDAIAELSFVFKGDCDSPEAIAGCPDCTPICYLLTNCDGTTIQSTAEDFASVVGNHVTLEGFTDSWLVQINEGVCSNPVNNLTITNSSADPCDCNCYEVISAPGVVSYTDCDGNPQLTFAPDKFCSQTPPLAKQVPLQPPAVIIQHGLCIDKECPDKCFLLTNCDPTAYPTQDSTITSTLQSLSQYVNSNSVVVLAGYEGCWTVTETSPCDCPLDLTIIRSYISCDECIGTIAYKLTNCENANEVIYSVQDLSAYVGNVLKDDCACWSVEQIDYQPPSQTTITTPLLFTNCTTCLTTYYQLDDCDPASSVPVIITSTNLSGYVGSVIQINGCTGCYTVSLYAPLTEPANFQEVTLTLDFTDCSTCGSTTPKCSTVFNNTTQDQTYTFINANGDSEVTDTVKSGHSSLRYCVQRWDNTVNPKGIFNFYGDCNVFENLLGDKAGFCVQYFPNDRKIKPGYNTPICSSEKYDKITCNFAEIAYKEALALRYGISNCCPELDEKWMISKELIELQALYDPKFKCLPTTDCCGKTGSNCSCNS
jgi:hypothetical protein